MVHLSREIRFALVPPEHIQGTKPTNSWAGWPSTNLIVPQLVLTCVIAGQPDSQTGYLCNVAVLDALLREIVIEKLIPEHSASQLDGQSRAKTAEELVGTVDDELKRRWSQTSESDLAAIVSVELSLSPYLRYTIVSSGEPSSMPTAASSTSNLGRRVQLTQQFEFSAAHRLNCDEFSESENASFFGKCNNLEGHGHNYVVEVTLANQVNDQNGQVIPLHEFELLVKSAVIDRLDHKHLNRDVEYFTSVNPSVENIATALFGWLRDALTASPHSAELVKVRVFETPKTWAEVTGH